MPEASATATAATATKNAATLPPPTLHETGWSGIETPGMKDAKCSLLLPVDGTFAPKIKALPEQKVLVHQDKTHNDPAETNSFHVEFPGCTIMQLEPVVAQPAAPTTMPVTLTVAGKCYFTAENFKDFKTMMRTKEQSQQWNIPINGSFDWPDVQSMLLCPLCAQFAPIPPEYDDTDSSTSGPEGDEYWMVFYPLIQITVMKGSKMTLGTRTICRLTCVECMHKLLHGKTLKVKQATAGEARSSTLSFSLSALEILKEAGSASFLQDAPPRPKSHAHVDDEMDAWTLYTLWEHSGAWEALQNDYRIVLSRSMYATAQPSAAAAAATAKTGSSSQIVSAMETSHLNERKCSNMACKKVHGKMGGENGEVVRLTVSCEACEGAFYCSKSCRRAAAPHHKELCSPHRQKDRTKKVKRLQCDACKNVLPYTQMKKCSRCKCATYCGLDCQRMDWGRHKFRCHIQEDE